MSREEQFQRLTYSESDSIAWITLNRPEKRNALDHLTIQELKIAFDLAGPDSDAGIIALKGEGSDFCSGWDLSLLEKWGRSGVAENLEDARSMMQMFLQMRASPKPVVGLVRGRALAGGCGLASACDLIIASDRAQFGYVEVKIGFVAAIVMSLLRRSVGEKRACELLLSGAVIDAREAERIGLVNHVFSDAEFDQRAVEWLIALAQNSGPSMKLTKELLYRIDGMTLEQAMESGAVVNALARMTPECRQGITQFLKRRK